MKPPRMIILFSGISIAAREQGGREPFHRASQTPTAPRSSRRMNCPDRHIAVVVHRTQGGQALDLLAQPRQRELPDHGVRRRYSKRGAPVLRLCGGAR